MSVRLAFLHIPKTAGTSVLRALMDAFGADGVMRVWPGAHAHARPDAFAATPIPAGCVVVAGHLTYAQITAHWAFRRRGLAAPYIVSVVRHPLDRAVSLFNHLHSGTPRRVLRGTLRAFAESLPQDRQCGFLSAPGVTPFDLARTQFICTLDNLETALTAALRQAGAQRILPLERLNTRTPLVRVDELDPDIAAIILDRSRGDLAFYDHLRRMETARHVSACSRPVRLPAGAAVLAPSVPQERLRATLHP